VTRAARDAGEYPRDTLQANAVYDPWKGYCPKTFAEYLRLHDAK